MSICEEECFYKYCQHWDLEAYNNHNLLVFQSRNLSFSRPDKTKVCFKNTVLKIIKEDNFFLISFEFSLFLLI